MYEKSVWVRFYENPPVPQEAAVELAALRKNKKRRQKNFSKPKGLIFGACCAKT